MALLGVILCGGKSTRMGTDKGLIKLHAGTWAQSAADKMNALKLPAAISINKEQLDTYSAFFSPSSLVIDKNTLEIHGPLCGLLSVHADHPDEDLMILGCDLPLMEVELLKELLTHYNLQKDKDAFVFTTDGEPEPLCGIYKSSALQKIYLMAMNHQLPKHSMKYVLDHINSHFTPVPADKKSCFRNFNAHAELNGL